LLRFDGVYHVRAFGETCYLRFYPDGTVVDACSLDPPRDIIESLNRNSPGVSRGSYHMVGRHISFSTINPAGVVDYSGTVAENSLFLHYHSRINDREGTHMFTFTQVAENTSSLPKGHG
jgi:hypothetical protein